MEKSAVTNNSDNRIHFACQSHLCTKCSAWKGQLGLEPTFDLYIKHLCDIFDQVKRVLKKSGTCWVNMGDTYWGGKGQSGNTADDPEKRRIEGKTIQRQHHKLNMKTRPQDQYGIYPSKSLCLIPSRFAVEMCNRGWILRNELIWWKPNCMPSSAKDRFTVDFEKLFFFAKNRRYYFETQFEAWTDTRKADIQRASEGHRDYSGKYKKGYNAEYRELLGGQGIKGQPVGNPLQGRHKRCVWRIPTTPFAEAHFAVYPEALIETPIKAGCPEFVCKKCGKPREMMMQSVGNFNAQGESGSKTAVHVGASSTLALLTKKAKEKVFTGYTQCHCNAGYEPGVVLDPFMGSGTTAVVALRLNRRFVGIETNQKYIDIAVERIKHHQTRLQNTFG